MNGIALDNCEIGTVSSMKDGSVKFTVYSAELRPSERGLVMEYHGKACAVVVKPHESEPDEMVRVNTERLSKSPSTRLRAVLFLLWRQQGRNGSFDTFYADIIEKQIDTVKEQLND